MLVVSRHDVTLLVQSRRSYLGDVAFSPTRWDLGCDAWIQFTGIVIP